MTVPKLRFPEFSDDWTVYKLSDFTKRVTRKNSNNESDLPLTISSLDGLISQSSFFDRQIASKDMSGYFLLKHGEFAYNKSYSKGFEFGSIKRLDKYPMGTLSTLYICFHLIQNDSDFMKYYFDSLKWYEQVYRISAEGARNHGLLNVSPHDFFSTKHVLPVLPEQKKIADFLSSFDKRIETTQKKLATLEKLKKGFMQKIFSQQLRFKDDDGNEYPAWEEKRLGEVTVKYKGNTLSKDNLDSEGMYPCLLYGELYTTYGPIASTILSRTNKLEKGMWVSEKEDVVVPVSGETAIDISTATCIKQNGVVIGGDLLILHSSRILGDFLSYSLNYPLKLTIAKYAQGASIVHMNIDSLMKVHIKFPSLPEQQKIADFLSAFDKKIDLVRKEVDTLQTIKKGLLQQMFV